MAEEPRLDDRPPSASASAPLPGPPPQTARGRENRTAARRSAIEFSPLREERAGRGRGRGPPADAVSRTSRSLDPSGGPSPRPAFRSFLATAVASSAKRPKLGGGWWPRAHGSTAGRGPRPRAPPSPALPRKLRGGGRSRSGRLERDLSLSPLPLAGEGAALRPRVRALADASRIPFVAPRSIGHPITPSPHHSITHRVILPCTPLTPRLSCGRVPIRIPRHTAPHRGS